MATTGKLSFVRHNDLDGVRRRLKAIREKDAENSILVVTEGLFIYGLPTAPNLFSAQGLWSRVRRGPYG
jgi:hypothetical protein